MAEKLSDAEIRKALGDAQDQKDQISRRSDYATAVSYLEGAQLDDVERELRQRYEQHQSGGIGEQIKPITIPLTQRYVSESANVYNKPVLYELVREDDTVDDDATAVLQSFLNDSGYTGSMHQIDQISTMLRSCGAWYQARRNLIMPRTVVPNVIWPIRDPMVDYPDLADETDYLGFVVQLTDDELMCADSSNDYVLITQAEHVYFKSQSPFVYDTESAVRFPNPYAWDQVVDETADGIPTGRGITKEDALQMLTFWHSQKPISSVIIDTDPDIAFLNREINIAWSVIAHIIRTQAHSQLVVKMTEAGSAPSRLNFGPSFGLSLDTEEDASFINAANNYTETVAALESLQQLYAIARRLSPNDFAQDGQTPTSGFAKLVDSLPKIEAREEKIARLKRTEETVAWPRIGAIMKQLGVLSNAHEYKMRVTFSDISFPRSVDEDVKEAEFEFKHGLSSPARVLAEREGMSLEEAEERIEKDKQEEKTNGPAGFGRAIARRGRRNGEGNRDIERED